MKPIICKCPKIKEEIVLGFKKLDAATVYEAGGKKGALPRTIKPLFPYMQLRGRAITVDAPGGDNLMVHAAVPLAVPGDVLVVHTGEYLEGGFWGEILTIAAKMRGIVGLVTDGAVRDSVRLEELDFPVFSNAVCVKSTTKSKSGTINHPITIDEIMISPGDIIVADNDCVVVVPYQEAEKTLNAARARQVDEREKIRLIKEGKSTLELFNLEPVLAELGLIDTKEK
jgi:4-hydroxy-4-methyl-2-oxoglutarate aldolase